MELNLKRLKAIRLIHPSNIRALTKLTLYGIFFAITLWVLRTILANPNIIGRIGSVSDWAVPAFPEESFRRIVSDLYVWIIEIGAGSYAPLKTPYYSIVTLPFGMLGGNAYGKFFLLALFWISAIAMFELAKNELRLGLLWSVFAGIMYAFSPASYFRLVVGHVNILLGYSLLPVFALLCFQCVRESAPSSQWRSTRVIAAGILLGLAYSLHQSVLVIYSLVAFAIFGMALTKRNLKQIIPSGVAILLLGLLANISWMLPFAVGNLSSGAVFHAWGINKPPDQISISDIIPSRQYLLDRSGAPLQDSIRWLIPNVSGLFAGLVPIQNTLAILCLVGGFLFAFCAFAVLLAREKSNRQILTLLALGILGVVMVSGTTNLFGLTLYDFLKKLSPTVWAEFGDTSRAAVLISLSFSALVPMALRNGSNWIGAQFARYRSGNNTLASSIWRAHKWASISIAVPLIALWSSYFSIVDIGRDRLKYYSVPAEDQALYRHLMMDVDDSRMTYIPPPDIWGAYDYNGNWDAAPSNARPRFLAPFLNTSAWKAASDFSSLWQTAQPGKMLGLAAVRYIVYRHTLFFDNLYRPKYDAVLAAQNNFKPLALPFSGTTILENEDQLPHIYATPNATMVLGSSDFLAPLSGTPYFGNAPAIFFSSQQSPANLAPLASRSWSVVVPLASSPILTEAGSTPSSTSHRASLIESRNVPRSDENTVYLMTIPTATVSAATSFSLPQPGSYVARIKAFAQPASDLVGTRFAYTATQVYLVEAPNLSAWSAARLQEKSDLVQYAWAMNTLFDTHRDQKNTLEVRALLTNAVRDNPYVQFTKKMSPFDLRDFPFLEISSGVQDPNIQLIEIRLGLDFTGDGIAETVWTLPLVPQTELKSSRVAVYDAIKLDWPDRPTVRVVNVTIRATTRPKVNWRTLQQGFYDFSLSEINFRSADQVSSKAINIVSTGSDVPKPESVRDSKASATSDTQGITIPFGESDRGATVTLNRSLPSLMAANGSLSYSLTYQVDGPAALALEFTLIGLDERGITRTIPLGTRLLEPFSSNRLNFEASLPSTVRLVRAEVGLSKLTGASELRPTTFSLNQFRVYGQSLQPLADAMPSAPALRIDDTNVALSQNAKRDDRGGAGFETQTLGLERGNHSLFVGYDDATTVFRVGTVELAPARLKVPTHQEPTPTTTFRSINPTRYLVHVDSSTAPFFLIFSDSFHDGWKAFVRPRDTSSPRWYEASALLSLLFDGGNTREVTDHYLVNGYANSWYVERTGSFDISLEFIPQRTYEAGLIVSGLTLCACLLYLMASRIKHARMSQV